MLTCILRCDIIHYPLQKKKKWVERKPWSVCGGAAINAVPYREEVSDNAEEVCAEVECDVAPIIVHCPPRAARVTASRSTHSRTEAHTFLTQG